MAELSDIRRAIDEDRWDDAIRELASVLSNAWQGERLAAWEKYCQGSNNLLWQYARRRVGNQQCQATVELLMNSAVLKFVDDQYRQRAGHLLRGLVRGIQVAAERKQGVPSNGKYETEGAVSFQQAFPALAGADNDVGQTMTAWIVQQICSPAEGNRHQAWTWGLLDGPHAKMIEIGIKLAPGETGRIVPDALAIAPVDIGDDFVKTLLVARDTVSVPAGYQLVWKLRRHEGLGRIDGGSVGAAVAAAVRGAVEGVTLDPCVAVSATLDADGTLGKVEGADNKLKHAADEHCDRVLLHPKTSVITSEDDKSLPEVALVETMEEVWEHLSSMHRVISAHHKRVQDEWESQWSEVNAKKKRAAIHNLPADAAPG